MEVGGIRISHMSHIERDMLLQLSVTKGKRAPTIIKPLVAEVKPITNTRQTAEQWAADHIAAVQNAADSDALDELLIKGSKPMGKLQGEKPELWAEVNTAYAARRGQLEQQGKPAADMGDGVGDDPFEEEA
jgi:hypothetical protein